jgi:hypothetical protein
MIAEEDPQYLQMIEMSAIESGRQTQKAKRQERSAKEAELEKERAEERKKVEAE